MRRNFLLSPNRLSTCRNIADKFSSFFKYGSVPLVLWRVKGVTICKISDDTNQRGTQNLEKVEDDIISEIMDHYYHGKDDNFVYFEIIKLMRLAKIYSASNGDGVVANSLVVLISLFLRKCSDCSTSAKNNQLDSFQLKQIFLPEISTII